MGREAHWREIPIRFVLRINDYDVWPRRSHVHRLYIASSDDKVESGNPWCFAIIQEYRLTDANMDENTARAAARLTSLEIDILHRQSPGDDAEQISINLRRCCHSRRSASSSEAPIRLRRGRRPHRWRGFLGLDWRVP